MSYSASGVETPLAADMGATDKEFTVGTTHCFPSSESCVVGIDDELILCDLPVGNSELRVVQRGYNGTLPAAHTATTAVALMKLDAVVVVPAPVVAEQLSQAAVPEAADDPGVKGEVRFDATDLYVCVAINTWVKTALSWVP